MASSNTRPRQSPNLRMIQNFHLVWLNGSNNDVNDDHCRNSITKLREVINTVNTFIDVDECIDFITDNNEEMTSIIVSGEDIQNVIPIVQEISQVNSIYIFYDNKAQSVKWTKECFKVKGMFTDITTICEALKQAVQDFDHNSICISFVQKTDESLIQNLNTLDQSFMYTQILKEILLTIDFEQSHINDFFTYCREQLVGNTMQLANFDKIAKEYHDHQPIWWYTYESLLYSMVNRALRLMEVDCIIIMGFFLRDLHNHIAKIHAEQFSGQNHSGSFTVYRGQGLSHTVFDQLKKTQGGLMSFNNFLSTSLDEAVSRAFAESSAEDLDLTGVLFEITIDPSIQSSPFANVTDVSYYQEKEEEILFSMHSVFRIGQVQPIEGNSRLYQVNLILTSDNDPQLHALTKSMREETLSGSKGWVRLGILLIKLGHSNKAEELHNILLEKTNDQNERAHLYHMLGRVKDEQGKYAESIESYEKALEIRRKTLPPYHPGLASSYGHIGLVYSNMGEYLKSLSYFEKALEISQKTLPANHPQLAAFYNNISSVYDKMGDYSKALLFLEKALEISQKTFRANHPDLATSYNNIGRLSDRMGEYSKALSYFEQALEIFEKTLPPNHPLLAGSYNNIGSVCGKIGKHLKALSFHEKALGIFEKNLPTDHPYLASSYNNIGLLYSNTGQYSKSLSYFEKALEIDRKTLPANHPDLAYSYNSISSMYDKMGEYSRALSYLEKALEISQKTLPANHPQLATSYNNVGSVCDKMGEYSKALSFLEKALEIGRKSLPENHPDLGASYNNIGSVYNKIGEYSKALSCSERALDIWKRSLPTNHPHLNIAKENIVMIKKRL